jgi:cytoskeletal protein CcmA (bactofilin family)
LKTRENGKDEVTIISTGVFIEGKVTSNGNVRIDGKLNGDISAEGNVTVGEVGEVNGEIKAEVINIGGVVNGTVTAREKLVLEAKSNLKGDLVTKILVIEAGAMFDGKSSMGSGGAKPASKPEPALAFKSNPNG